MTPPTFDPAPGGNQEPFIPARAEVLGLMLKATGRGGVPIRSDFVQLREKDADGSRRGLLSKFTTDERALDAYLLIHALASSKAPYSAKYPSGTWALAAGFDREATMTSARQRWSKAVAKLVKHRLIKAERDGRRSVYTLLHERGDGEPYSRPTSLAQGGWVSLPHKYWLEGLDLDLSLPEKLMLLISMDQKATFTLPAARTQEWYGVSESSAKRGFAGLQKKGIIQVGKKHQIDLQSSIIVRTVNTFTTLNEWTFASRKEAMTVKRTKSGRRSSGEAGEDKAKSEPSA